MGHGHGHVALEIRILLEHQAHVEASAEDARLAAVLFLVGIVVADAQGRADIAGGKPRGFLVPGFRAAFHGHGQGQHDPLAGEPRHDVQGKRRLTVPDLEKRAVRQHARRLAEHHLAEVEVLLVNEEFGETPGMGFEYGPAHAQLGVHMAVLLLKMHGADAHALGPDNPFRKHALFSCDTIRPHGLGGIQHGCRASQRAVFMGGTA